MRNPSGVGWHPERAGERTGVEAAREKGQADVAEKRGCWVGVVNGGVRGTTIVGESAFGCSTYWFDVKYLDYIFNYPHLGDFVKNNIVRSV